MNVIAKKGGMLCVSFLFILSAYAQPDWHKPILNSQQHAVNTQAKINALDHKTQVDLQTYQAVLRDIKQLEKYTQNLQKLVDEQLVQQRVLQERKTQLQQTERQLAPLLHDLIDGLTQFIQSDPQFLPNERQERLAALLLVINDPQRTLSQKYDAVLSAYTIEANYAKMLLTWMGQVAHESSSLSVQFFAVGRVALYYLTPDGERGGIWLTSEQRWLSLNQAQRRDLQHAIEIANRQKPEHVIAVPVRMMTDHEE